MRPNVSILHTRHIRSLILTVTHNALGCTHAPLLNVTLLRLFLRGYTDLILLNFVEAATDNIASIRHRVTTAVALDKEKYVYKTAALRMNSTRRSDENVCSTNGRPRFNSA